MTADKQAEASTTLARHIRDRMRDNHVRQLDIANTLNRSQSWVSSILLNDPAATVRRLYVKEPDTLNALVTLLRLDDTILRHAISEALEHDGRTTDERIPLTHRVEVYPLGAGPDLNHVQPVTRLAIPPAGSTPTFGLLVQDDSLAPYLDSGGIAVIAQDPTKVKPGSMACVYVPHLGHRIYRMVKVSADLLLEVVNPANENERYLTPPEGARVVGPVVKRLLDG